MSAAPPAGPSRCRARAVCFSQACLLLPNPTASAPASAPTPPTGAYATPRVLQQAGAKAAHAYDYFEHGKAFYDPCKVGSLAPLALRPMPRPRLAHPAATCCAAYAAHMQVAPSLPCCHLNDPRAPRRTRPLTAGHGDVHGPHHPHHERHDHQAGG